MFPLVVINKKKLFIIIEWHKQHKHMKNYVDLDVGATTTVENGLIFCRRDFITVHMCENYWNNDT